MDDLSIPSYLKKDTVLNTPGQFIFQLLEDDEIKIGKNHQIGKKRIEEIIESIRQVFKTISDNLSKYAENDYYNIIVKKLKNFVNSKTLRFPGLQVINMSKEHIEIFSKICDRILICEKSDGVRYLLIGFANGKNFFVGRNLEFFEIRTDIKLPTSGNKKEWEIETFLDGELIIDKFNGQLTGQNKKNIISIEDTLHKVNFLVFDAIILNGENIGHLKFRERLKSLSNFFFLKESKNKFFKEYQSLIDKDLFASIERSTPTISNQRFSIEIFMKDYFTFDKINHLYSTTTKKLAHENDGVIINLDDYPYYSGQSFEIYKWKPANLNSIDFEITLKKIGEKVMYILNVAETRDKLLPVSILFLPENLEGEEKEFQTELESLNISGKPLIAECYFDFEYSSESITNYHMLVENAIIKRSEESGLNLTSYNHSYYKQAINSNSNFSAKGGWRFMRFRKDKLLPNSLYTYNSVWKTILENLQMQDIMDKIEANANSNLILEGTINLSTFLKTKMKKGADLNEPILETNVVAKEFLNRKRTTEQQVNTPHLEGQVKNNTPKKNMNLEKMNLSSKKETKALKDKEKKEMSIKQQSQTLQFAFGKDSKKFSNENLKNKIIATENQKNSSTGVINSDKMNKLKLKEEDEQEKECISSSEGNIDSYDDSLSA